MVGFLAGREQQTFLIYKMYTKGFFVAAEIE